MDHEREAVVARERRLLDPDVRDDDAAARPRLREDFREFDSTGTVWDYRSIAHATGVGTEKPIVAGFPSGADRPGCDPGDLHGTPLHADIVAHIGLDP